MVVKKINEVRSKRHPDRCSNVSRMLVFDIGLHDGSDTAFYLKKGFSVVGLEANPKLCKRANKNFKREIKQGRLHVIENALAYNDNELIEFYVNPEKDDWGSLAKEYAERDNAIAEKIKVPTITLSHIIKKYGIPYYIKCDIEGGDAIFVHQLLVEQHRPIFVSIEAMSLTDLARLHSCGYDRFQIVNQQFISYMKPPKPPLEGRYVDRVFTGHMSGLFGLELPPDKWIGFEQACELYENWRKMHLHDKLLAPGWLDFHVGYSDYIDSHMKK